MKGLSKMTTRSRKLGQDRLARLGTQDLTLRFDHQHLEMDDRARQREILAKAKADPEQGIAGVQKAQGEKEAIHTRSRGEKGSEETACKRAQCIRSRAHYSRQDRGDGERSKMQMRRNAKLPSSRNSLCGYADERHLSEPRWANTVPSECHRRSNDTGEVRYNHWDCVEDDDQWFQSS